MNYSEIFDSFSKLKVLVVGDVMVDAYYFGKVDRISPEAPVPVVALQRKENRLGGAANVALNVKSMGADAVLCSVVGEDAESAMFLELLKQNNLTDKGIVKSKSRITTVKTRVIGNNHQMLRIDQEVTQPLDAEAEQLFCDKIPELLEGINVVIFSDYDKGVLTEKLISTMIAEANKRIIPTIVDPKKRNFLNYKQATIFKPNLKELQEGLKLLELNPTTKNIDAALAELKKQLGHDISMVTLSEHGIYISDDTQKHHLPAHIRHIADVSGAGDSVVSVAALCLASSLPIREIAYLSNLAGGIVCEEIGVVPINKEKLLQEALNSIEA